MQEKQQQKESNLGCYFRISIQEYEIIFDKTNVQNCLLCIPTASKTYK